MASDGEVQESCRQHSVAGSDVESLSAEGTKTYKYVSTVQDAGRHRVEKTARQRRC